MAAFGAAIQRLARRVRPVRGRAGADRGGDAVRTGAAPSGARVNVEALKTAAEWTGMALLGMLVPFAGIVMVAATIWLLRRLDDWS